MASSLDSQTPDSRRWFQGLDRYCWIVLVVAALGWMFDTMDQNLFNLVRAPSLKELGASDKGGAITSIFLLGWSCGGFLFGILGDRLGRAKTMVVTILVYAIFTGASGLVHSWQMYAAMRFMVALGVGGEWAAGAALVAETFPARSRPMALGLLQALSAVGNMVACLITLAIPDNWRMAYFVGAAPALLVLWIATSVKEPPSWHEAKASAALGRELGSISELFTNAILRRRVISAVLLATAGVGSLWGIAYFSPDLIRSELRSAGTNDATIGRDASIIFLVQQAGAFFGAYLFAVVAGQFGRRPTFILWFVGAWASILAFFWGIQGSGADAYRRALFLAPLMGFCTLGPFSGYTIYFPELFPTRLRATGCGFCYNAARVLATIAPFVLGSLSKHGFAQAATVVSGVLIFGFVGAILGPETHSKPLPADDEFDSSPLPAAATVD